MVRYARVVYSPHALDSMTKRAIPEQVVADILFDPDLTYPNRDKLVAERVLGDGKPWRVVFVEDQAADGLVARVVTVYRIDRLKAR